MGELTEALKALEERVLVIERNLIVKRPRDVVVGAARLSYDKTALVINERGDDIDFRVESDTLTDAFKVDAGNEQVSVGGFFNLKVISELTIASGAITVTGSHHTVDTESDASTDDLDTINGGNTGDILLLEPVNSARTIVVKHGSDNIRTGADVTLDDIDDNILLQKQANARWTMIASSNNG